MTTMERPLEHVGVNPPDDIRTWLRFEGLAAFIAGLALCGWFETPWLLVVPLLLVPDISMAGYLGGPRLGAATYNIAHNWGVGLAVLGLGLLSDVTAVSILGAVLIAHVGMDRALGYGLKLSSGFQDTHLGRIGQRRQS
jgi:Domain of unknown function (DUF4260)